MEQILVEGKQYSKKIWMITFRKVIDNTVLFSNENKSTKLVTQISDYLFPLPYTMMSSIAMNIVMS